MWNNDLSAIQAEADYRVEQLRLARSAAAGNIRRRPVRGHRQPRRWQRDG